MNKFLYFLFVFCTICGLCDESIEMDEFDLYMGRGTSHWNNLSKTDEIDFLQSLKKIYFKNKKVEEISSFTEIEIPKVVHFIWLGPKPFPPFSVENVRTWLGKNPDWTFKFWTDRERIPPCHGMEVRYVKDFSFKKLGKCYEESENWGEKSDLLRYEILFQEGGVYADHDANCLIPFDDLNNKYRFYCCLEAPHPEFVEKNITCGNGVLGSIPEHPIIEKVIDLIYSRWDILGRKFKGNDPYSKGEIVMQRTYIALTDVLRSSLQDLTDRDIVFPSAYFFAKNGIKEIYSKHFYANSWSEDMISQSDFEKRVRRAIHACKKKINVAVLAQSALILFSFLTTCATCQFLRKRNKMRHQVKKN